jgi:hypothetical protein
LSSQVGNPTPHQQNIAQASLDRSMGVLLEKKNIKIADVLAR